MPALVPMIDMLTILVVYLLVHAADYEIVPNTKNISIPQSISDAKPHEATTVTVTKDTIYVNGAPVAKMADVLATSDAVIDPLKTALVNEASKTLVAGVASAAQAAEGREVTELADKSLPYAMLKKVMATCSSADSRNTSTGKCLVLSQCRACGARRLAAKAAAVSTITRSSPSRVAKFRPDKVTVTPAISWWG